MGISTNAVLFFGFTFAEGDDCLGNFLGDWEMEYAGKKGLAAPDFDFPEDGDPDRDAKKKLWREYWDAVNELIGASGCKMDAHCSSEYPMWYVCVGISEKTASRGNPLELALEDLVVGDDWVIMLRDFCDKVGIEWEEPKWWMASDWC